MLKADSVTEIGGVAVHEFLLTKHNPNKISMPNTAMNSIEGITIHNTDWITVASGTTPAEQYTIATYKGYMSDVRVHYYVDHACAWQNLPHNLTGWHAADGNGKGNRHTIAIECIMSPAYNAKDKQSEDNTARLAAALLKQYGLGIECLFTHTHWLNVRDGKSGSVDTLNTMKHSYKMCPLYILPHCYDFKKKVQEYKSADSQEEKPYRVRRTWEDTASQIGAYSTEEAAIAVCTNGYSVFDRSGKAVYTAPSKPSDKDDAISEIMAIEKSIEKAVKA